MKATIIYEYYHSVYGRINTNGTWSWKPDIEGLWNYNDGVGMYRAEVYNSGRVFFINIRTLKAIDIGAGGTRNLVNPIWNSPIAGVNGQFWYTLPGRFSTPLIFR